jgi:hypothetical protein
MAETPKNLAWLAEEGWGGPSTPHSLAQHADWESDRLHTAARDHATTPVGEARLLEAMRLALDENSNDVPRIGALRVTIRFWIDERLWTKDVRVRAVPRIGECITVEHLQLRVKDVEYVADAYDVSDEMPDAWLDVKPEYPIEDWSRYLTQYGWK